VAPRRGRTGARFEARLEGQPGLGTTLREGKRYPPVPLFGRALPLPFPLRNPAQDARWCCRAGLARCRVYLATWGKAVRELAWWGSRETAVEIRLCEAVVFTTARGRKRPFSDVTAEEPKCESPAFSKLFRVFAGRPKSGYSFSRPAQSATLAPLRHFFAPGVVNDAGPRPATLLESAILGKPTNDRGRGYPSQHAHDPIIFGPPA